MAGQHHRDETGSITPFVVIISLGILLLAALVVDGGRQLNGKGRAVAYAQEAARAGAQAVDIADPELDILPPDAVRAAAQYCDQAMAADAQLVRCNASTTTVNDPDGSFRAVEVKTQVRFDAILLSMIGRHVLNSSGEAVARPVSGISEVDSSKQSTLAPPSVAPPGDDPPETAPPEPPDDDVTPCEPDNDDDDGDDGGDDGDEDNGDDGASDDGDDDSDASDDDDDADDDDADDDDFGLEPCPTPEPGS